MTQGVKYISPNTEDDFPILEAFSRGGELTTYGPSVKPDGEWVPSATVQPLLVELQRLRESPQPSPLAANERVAQLIAHRACTNEEHAPEQGKISGFCVVCGVPWPCAIALPALPPPAGLREYVRHKPGCASLCQRCGERPESGRHREGWVAGSGVFWHDFIPGSRCDCGLSDALLADAPERTATKS
jgi:hypothetical protein